MTRIRFFAATLVTAILTTVVPAGPAAAGEERSGRDNVAVAVNTKDGSDVFRLAFQVNRVTSDVVDNTNAAVAFASCNDCQTVAIAIQVVLIMSDASVVTPENLAIAINQGCSACDTLASAYQLVLSTGGPVRLMPEGRRRIAEIRRQLRDLRHSGLTAAEIQARVAALTAELRSVIKTQLVPIGRPITDPEHQSPMSRAGPATTTPERETASSTSTSTSTSSTSTSTTARTSTTTTVP